MIFLTGASGFVGSHVIRFFGRNNIIISNRGSTYKIENSSIVIHLAGKAEDDKLNENADEYYFANYVITKRLYDSFISSNAHVFIMLSSVKAIADTVKGELTEEIIPNPETYYGKSKLLAELYISSKKIPKGKRVYVLRPCIIHGPGCKGRLSLLYKLVSKKMPWPLGDFMNKRSFCSIDNLLFVINELVKRKEIPSGFYNIADDEPISTNELIRIISFSQNRNAIIWRIPRKFFLLIAKIGDIFHLSFNSFILRKLTNSYIVSNKKLILALGKPLPLSSREGLVNTFKSFKKQ